MWKVSIKLANCNRNFATWPFSHQKKLRKHYGAFVVQNNEFDVKIHILLTSNMLK